MTTKPTAHGEFDGAAAAYALGALDLPEKQVFEAHLATCATCQAELRDMQRVVVGIGQATASGRSARGTQSARPRQCDGPGAARHRGTWRRASVPRPRCGRAPHFGAARSRHRHAMECACSGRVARDRDWRRHLCLVAPDAGAVASSDGHRSVGADCLAPHRSRHRPSRRCHAEDDHSRALRAGSDPGQLERPERRRRTRSRAASGAGRTVSSSRPTGFPGSTSRRSTSCGSSKTASPAASGRSEWTRAAPACSRSTRHWSRNHRRPLPSRSNAPAACPHRKDPSC